MRAPQISWLLWVLALAIETPAGAGEPAATSTDNATELAALRKELAPYFQPPAEYAGDFGKYKSPLRFDDGHPVTTADEWRQRRVEILKTWHAVMGAWPPLVEKPTIEYLETQ